MRKLLIILIFLPLISNAAPRKRIELDAVTTKELLKIIDQSEALRKSLFSKKDTLIGSQISQLRKSIDQSLKIIDGRQTPHILKVLRTVNQDLSNAQMSGGASRTKFLESAYKQIVTLYQSYKIDAPYKVFFCQIDRGVWIQESKKPENPFLKETTCGRPVPF